MSSENGVPTTLDPDPDSQPVQIISSIEDRRSSFRMSSETRAVLRVGRRELVVALGDQSRGGFLVWLDRSPPFTVDQAIFIRSGRGWSKVRVAYIDRVDARYRVGLEFLEDLDDSRHGRIGSRSGSRWKQARGVADCVYFFGILFFATLVAGLVITKTLFPGPW
jgi:hypothetical protein